MLRTKLRFTKVTRAGFSKPCEAKKIYVNVSDEAKNNNFQFAVEAATNETEEKVSIISSNDYLFEGTLNELKLILLQAKF